ncbi:MAG: hypothetical protein HOP11_02065 [Saprospiraceae bacterium]|nr:hypothetical protein [Saprospiraceae bacterium]
MRKSKYILIFVCVAVGFLVSVAQSGAGDTKNSKPGLPTCFLTGEYELAYDLLLEEYDKALVTVCDNDNEKAYAIWSTILFDLSEYAKTTEMDLNGVKLWINIFFNNNGSIKHIVYYPKPNSRNMDFDKLTSFFTSFCNTYKVKETLKHKCMLSATASFPIFVKK